MVARILDGEVIAAGIKEQIKKELGHLKQEGKMPLLAAVQVGENPASRVYIRAQQRSCEEIGIDYQLHELEESTGEHELINYIEKLNGDRTVTGVILQMPVPEHINARQVQAAISPSKDVEGVNPANMGLIVYGHPHLAPCTAMGVVEIIKSTGVDMYGKEVTMVGHSDIVGKPVALLLLDQFATTTVCHIATKDLACHTRNADIIIVAVGKPGLIKGDMIKPGAIVIDVGINRVEVKDENGNPVKNDKGKIKKRTVGDVLFDEAKEVASMITPVPGGVGPLTTAILLRNTVEAAGFQLVV